MNKLALREYSLPVEEKRKRNPNRTLLYELESVRDDALIRLGMSTGLWVSEIVVIRSSEIDFVQGIIKIWDEKKDLWWPFRP